MRLHARSALVIALGFGLAVVLASGARAGDPARDLSDIEPAQARDVDDANTAEAEDLDAVTGDGAEEADVVDSEDHEAQAQAEDADVVDSRTLDQAEQAPGWTPPACEDVPVDLGMRPDNPGDVDTWRANLQDAQAAIEKTRTRLAAADAEYTYARNRKSPRGEAFARIVAERDTARDEYARARCSLPARIEAARRMGVSPDVWRDFPASID
jgi:hypothetical protein